MRDSCMSLSEARVPAASKNGGTFGNDSLLAVISPMPDGEIHDKMVQSRQEELPASVFCGIF